MTYTQMRMFPTIGDLNRFTVQIRNHLSGFKVRSDGTLEHEVDYDQFDIVVRTSHMDYHRGYEVLMVAIIKATNYLHATEILREQQAKYNAITLPCTARF